LLDNCHEEHALQLKNIYFINQCPTLRRSAGTHPVAK